MLVKKNVVCVAYKIKKGAGHHTCTTLSYTAVKAFPNILQYRNPTKKFCVSNICLLVNILSFGTSFNSTNIGDVYNLCNF